MFSGVLAVIRCVLPRFLDFFPLYGAPLPLYGASLPLYGAVVRVYRAPGSLFRISYVCTARLSHVSGFPAVIQDASSVIQHACSVIQDACSVIRDARAIFCGCSVRLNVLTESVRSVRVFVCEAGLRS